MAKKRFRLAFILVISLLVVLLSHLAFAGCCYGVIGCSRAFVDTQCSGLTVFSGQDCEDIPDCEVVACCHNIPGIAKATYSVVCDNIEDKDSVKPIGPFVTDPTTEESYANTLCAGANPACTYNACEKANSPGCACGAIDTSEGNIWCCAKDSSIFPDIATCTQSPSCYTDNFFSVSGKVVDNDDNPVPGAIVRAAGKQELTQADGTFIIEYIPDQSSGVVMAIKNNAINSTAYSVDGADVGGLIIVLDISGAPVIAGEDCTNGWDDDGDQFGWNSSKEWPNDPILRLAADKCDTECSSFNPLYKVKKSVSLTYFRQDGERTGPGDDACSDNVDNDCDGMTDCDDVDCADSSACSATFCGDGVVDFPNALGEFEQCDLGDGSGPSDDSRCPGKCVAAGEADQCRCQYEAVCGNGIIDEPLEDCDGVFIASQNLWDLSKYNSGDPGCRAEDCGTPNSARPCQCPPSPVCGNGKKEDPEECDPGNPGESIDPDDGSCSGQCDPNCKCPPAEAICGNNLIEKSEDCDGNWDPFATGWDPFKYRKYGCNKNTCAPPEDVWTAYPDNMGKTYSDYYPDGPCTCPTKCDEQPAPIVLEPVKHVQYEHRLLLSWADPCATTENPNIEAYNVQRCSADDINGTGCLEPGSVWSTINSDPLASVDSSYEDQIFDPSTPSDGSKYYCYRVQGLYDTITDIKESYSELDPDIHCVRAGDEYCYLFQEIKPGAQEFCKYNIRSVCDENNSIIPVPDNTELVDCSQPVEIYTGVFQDYMCVGPFPKDHEREFKTQCIPRAICDYCQDPFGLFAFSRSQQSPNRGIIDDEILPGIALDYGTAPYSADDGAVRGQGNWLPCLSLEFCYIDQTYTSVDKFKSIDKVHSCYDYDSEYACLMDKALIGNCEWVDHPEYAELGIGVCRTNVTELQNCSVCHDPINRVYGKCDKEMCGLYGRCYYDRAKGEAQKQLFRADATLSGTNFVKTADFGIDNNYYKCRHEREISCDNYDSYEDCVNSSSVYSLDAEFELGSSLDLNVSGNYSLSRFWKNGGNNSILNQSDDYFGFGKCQWGSSESYYWTLNTVTNEVSVSHFTTNERCIKNSDDSVPKNTSTYSPYYNTTWLDQYSDCYGISFSLLLGDVSDCRKDITSPNTNIPVYANMRLSGSFGIMASVFDDSLDYTVRAYYPTTYACFAEDGMDCYPQGEADFISRELGNNITAENVNWNVSYNITDGIRSGWYTLKYFSEDISHNLEPVKSVRVYLDTLPPNMNVTWSYDPWEMYTDVWKSNLSLTLFVQPRPELEGMDDEFAYCSANLNLREIPIYPGQDIINEYNNSWDRFYDQLPDDYYIFSYRCIDDVGNVAEDSVEILIDGDRSITNPLPRKTLANQTVVLSVETGTNAECRYLRSEDDLPQFDPDTPFDPATFDTMTPFDYTGTPEQYTNLHRSELTLDPGFYRYYVKCFMFEDETYRGNNGDNIKFAIDTEPPGTYWDASEESYNNWYNQDIAVTLSCEDRLLYGHGMPWDFGCEYTMYCIGKDCDTLDEWRLFEGFIPMTKTTYISYYSVDRGGNVEPLSDYNKNVAFQIDKGPANVTIQVLENDADASVIVLEKVYKVVLNSSKPIISPAVETPTLTFISDPQKFEGTVDLLPTDDPDVWEGMLTFENINANKGFEGNLIFEATGHDYHNVPFSGSTTIPMDTNPPTMPVVEPSLELPSPLESDYELMGYPIHYFNGTYFTNQPVVKITGYTDELLDVIGVTTVNNLDTEHPFTQQYTNVTHNDSILSAIKGSNIIRVAGDITGRVSVDDYVGFDDLETTIGPRTLFGYYGMFYDIIGMEYIGGDEQYTQLSVYPLLEQTYVQDTDVFFYDRESPSLWFGLNLELDPLEETHFYLKAYDAAHNIIRYPPISTFPPYLVFFYDPYPPRAISHKPREGSTSKSSFEINLTVAEGKLESGFDLNKTRFTINGDNVDFGFEELDYSDSVNQYYKIYYDATDLEDGVYEVAIEAPDMAGNALSEEQANSSWTIMVDRTLPADPIIEFNNCNQGVNGDDRWYCRELSKGADFTVDFSAEYNQVTISDVFLDSEPSIGEEATCTELPEEKNVFDCEFVQTMEPDPSIEYSLDDGVSIEAYKTLDDGSNSSKGLYGPVMFTVDNIAPEFTLDFNHRMRDRYNLSIVASVINEKHPLVATLNLRGIDYYPIYSAYYGSQYRFDWDVPDLTGDTTGDYEDMDVKLTDFAGNTGKNTEKVYIDLTAPRVSNIEIKVSDTVEIGGQYYTAISNVTVTGLLLDDDIASIWTVPGDYNATTGQVEDKAIGSIYNNNTFSITVAVPGREPGTPPIVYKEGLNEYLISRVNDLVLYVQDEAGHVSKTDLTVIRDFEQALEPEWEIN